MKTKVTPMRQNIETRPRIMTVYEVSRYLRVHVSSVYRMLEVNKIPSFKIGGLWRFRKDAIDKWIAQKEKTEVRIRSHKR